MQLNNESWQPIAAENFDRVLKAAGGGLRLVRGDGSGVPATGGISIGNGESVMLDAGVDYAARAWLSSSVVAEIL